MTSFQHIAVAQGERPHVTVVAGIDMAGRHWCTTSTEAAKVRFVRARPFASVVRQDVVARTGVADEWTLTAGRSTVLDVRHLGGGLADPVAAGLAGVALTRIGLANLEQLVGYFDDRANIPSRWSPAARVLIVTRDDHRLVWRGGRVVEATGSFSTARLLVAPTRTRRRAMSTKIVAALSLEQRTLATRGGRCAIGLSTVIGPVVVPGRWDPESGAVSVPSELLARLGATLPGNCSVTIDSSDDIHPSAKFGVMLRGSADLIAPRRTDDSEWSSIAITVESVTGWSGFEATTFRAAS